MSDVNLLAENMQLRSQLDDLARVGREATADSQITQALADIDLVDGAGPQVVALLKSQVNVQNDGQQFIAFGPGMRPIRDYVREQLASPAFAHFHKPVAQRQQAAQQQAIPIEQMTQEQRQALHAQGLGAWIEANAAAARQRKETSDPSRDMSRPMGLGRGSYQPPGTQDPGKRA